MDMPAQVQVIENQSQVTGLIVRVAPHKTSARHSIVTLNVETVEPVEGYANLLDRAKGLALEIAVPSGDVTSLRIAPGRKVTWIVKRTTPTSAAFVRGGSATVPVQPVENQADVTGRIRTLLPHAQLRGYVVATIDVESVASVADYPNLFDWAGPGTSLDVNVPEDVVASEKLAAGQKVTWRIKKTGPTAAFLVPPRR